MSRYKNITAAFEMLTKAYGRIPTERLQLAGRFLCEDKRTLPLESIKYWILNYDRAPYINELYAMSVECSDD